jgi:glutathione synthase/RimK-type ligase-like ATP-grasp enzyme
MVTVVQNWGPIICDYDGSTNVLSNLDRPDLRVVKLVLPAITVNGKDVNFNLPKIDVIFNSICDPDVSQDGLYEAERVIGMLRAPVINEPRHIRETCRDNVSAILQDLNGIVVPKTIRIAPRRRSEVLGLAAEMGLEPPFIVRPLGSHGGKGVQRIGSAEDVPLLDQFAFDGQPYYVTAFIDTRSADGYYRKYRFFVVDGKALPRHLIIADEWMIHNQSRASLMDHDEALRQEEAHFLHSDQSTFAGVFRQIAQRLKLDYFIVDCGLLDDQRPVIFEINACAELGATEDLPTRYEYHRPVVGPIISAVEQLVRRKAATHA